MADSSVDPSASAPVPANGKAIGTPEPLPPDTLRPQRLPMWLRAWACILPEWARAGLLRLHAASVQYPRASAVVFYLLSSAIVFAMLYIFIHTVLLLAHGALSVLGMRSGDTAAAADAAAEAASLGALRDTAYGIHYVSIANVDTPFLDCINVTNPDASDWLLQRFNEQGDFWRADMDRYSFSSRCCVREPVWVPQPVSGPAAERAAMQAGLRMKAELSKTTAAEFVAQWQPRVEHAFIDCYGDVFLRVVRWDDTLRAFRAEAMRYRDLLAAAQKQYRALVAELGDQPGKGPCMCPLHWGIMFSGMHLTRSEEFLAGGAAVGTGFKTTALRTGSGAWKRGLLEQMSRDAGAFRLLTHVGMRPLSSEDEEEDAGGGMLAPLTITTQLEQKTRLYPFPTELDHELLPPAARKIEVPATMQLQAIELLPLFLRELQRSVDKFFANAQSAHPLDGDAAAHVDDDDARKPQVLGQLRDFWLQVSMAELLQRDDAASMERREIVRMYDNEQSAATCMLHCHALEIGVFPGPVHSAGAAAGARGRQLVDAAPVQPVQTELAEASSPDLPPPELMDAMVAAWKRSNAERKNGKQRP